MGPDFAPVPGRRRGPPQPRHYPQNNTMDLSSTMGRLTISEPTRSRVNALNPRGSPMSNTMVAGR